MFCMIDLIKCKHFKSPYLCSAKAFLSCGIKSYSDAKVSQFFLQQFKNIKIKSSAPKTEAKHQLRVTTLIARLKKPHRSNSYNGENRKNLLIFQLIDSGMILIRSRLPYFTVHGSLKVCLLQITFPSKSLKYTNIIALQRDLSSSGINFKKTIMLFSKIDYFNSFFLSQTYSQSGAAGGSNFFKIAKAAI